MTKIKTIAIILLLSFTISVSASAFDISAAGGCSMDFDTGEFFYKKNADTPMVPASMTKVMTLYLIFEKLAGGEVTKDTPVPISQNVENEASRKGYTNIPLKAGSSVTLDTIISGIVTVSACGASTAAAEFIAGSEAEFVNLMNKKAEELGINAHFTDASGISDYNTITPAAMATLVRSFITKYPDILNYTKKEAVTIAGKTYTSTNLLLKNGSGGYFYSGVDGFKTGTTNKAGKCIVSTAYRDGHRVISVVMKAPSNADRYKDSITLLDDAFSHFDHQNFLYTTDAVTYIDGFEIPCCYYPDENKTLYVIAENLNSFGFDTHYDSTSSTLYIYDNPSKEIYTMVPGDDEPGTPIYKVNKNSGLKVVLVKKNVHYPLSKVFSLNGMCAISFEELGKYFSYSWNNNSRKAYLNAG